MARTKAPRAEIGPQVADQVQPERAAHVAGAGGLPFVPAHRLHASIDAGRLQLDEAIRLAVGDGEDVEPGVEPADAHGLELEQDLLDDDVASSAARIAAGLWTSTTSVVVITVRTVRGVGVARAAKPTDLVRDRDAHAERVERAEVHAGRGAWVEVDAPAGVRASAAVRWFAVLARLVADDEHRLAIDREVLEAHERYRRRGGGRLLGAAGFSMPASSGPAVGSGSGLRPRLGSAWTSASSSSISASKPAPPAMSSSRRR